MPSPAESPRTKRWTRQECQIIESVGLFAGKKFELIDGELISTMGKNSPHVITVVLVHKWLGEIFGLLQVQQEASIDVATQDNDLNEPEPDLVVLRQPRTRYTENPQPHDVLLLVEVSDTTLRFDLKQKARLYARAGILDYWVLDVNQRRLIVHREPKDGNYTSVLVYGAEETIAPLAAPKSPFRVAALLRSEDEVARVVE
ncbi:MAG: Uma2 family endonuclease [Bryobacterales bacterium]|nr:Uma2 family endonuclease [Bryobacterales bacterium]